MKKKILVVDDSRTARQQVKHALSETGYEIIEAADGQEGLAQIDAHADAALVICDVNMPNLDGLAMLSALREQKGPKAPPTVMLTTEAELELVQRAKANGARGWIVKPFKPHMLVAAVRKLVGDA